jgi:hypothetical protein
VNLEERVRIALQQEKEEQQQEFMRSATPHLSGVFDENSIDFKLESG